MDAPKDWELNTAPHPWETSPSPTATFYGRYRGIPIWEDDHLPDAHYAPEEIPLPLREG